MILHEEYTSGRFNVQKLLPFAATFMLVLFIKSYHRTAWLCCVALCCVVFFVFSNFVQALGTLLPIFFRVALSLSPSSLSLPFLSDSLLPSSLCFPPQKAVINYYQKLEARKLVCFGPRFINGFLFSFLYAVCSVVFFPSHLCWSSFVRGKKFHGKRWMSNSVLPLFL